MEVSRMISRGIHKTGVSIRDVVLRSHVVNDTYSQIQQREQGQLLRLMAQEEEQMDLRQQKTTIQEEDGDEEVTISKDDGDSVQ